MELYEITIDGKFITFSGIAGAVTGLKASHRGALIKELRTQDGDDTLTMVTIDNSLLQYLYFAVKDPGTGDAFTDLITFRTYVLTELNSM